MPKHNCQASAEEIALFEQCEKRLEKNPNDVDALIQVGFLCMDPFYDPDRSLSSLQQACTLDPMNMQAHFWLAKTLYHVHCLYKETKMALDKALQIDPNNAECCDLLASILCGLKEDPNNSIALLQRAIENQPGWLLPRIRLAYYF
jgi:cytochrome c-type biogenesis protein CcmH/NrfG